jgi:hypothetical protein
MEKFLNEFYKRERFHDEPNRRHTGDTFHVKRKMNQHINVSAGERSTGKQLRMELEESI